MITPIDIRNQEFDGKMRGYDRQQVDDYLRQIASTLEQLNKENKELQDELDWAVKRLDNYEDMQESLNKSIIVAQDAADQLKENSTKEADVIVSDAQNQANQVLREAVNEAKVIRQETEELRKQSRSFRQRLQIMIESQLELLENQKWDEVLNEAHPDEESMPQLARLSDSSSQQSQSSTSAREVSLSPEEADDTTTDSVDKMQDESVSSFQYIADPYQSSIQDADEDASE